MHELLYTTGTIRTIENEAKKPFTEVLADYSINNIIFLVQKGMGAGTSEEDAIKEIDKYLVNKEGQLEDLYLSILEKLEDAGFLPSQVKVEQMKKALKGE